MAHGRGRRLQNVGQAPTILQSVEKVVQLGGDDPEARPGEWLRVVTARSEEARQ